MKFLISFVFFIFLSINSYANDELYLCKLDTKFYETDKNEWSQKIIDYDLLISGESEVKILDKYLFIRFCFPSFVKYLYKKKGIRMPCVIIDL